MQKYDVPALGEALNGLAEVFDKKAVPQKAFELWFETLKEFPAERVIGLLSNWPKGRGKFPVPSEIWKVLNEWAIDERERSNVSQKKQIQREYGQMGATPHGERALDLIKTMLATPKPTPLEHWRSVMATPGLCDLSYEYAKKYLKRHDDFNKQVSDLDSPVETER